MTTPARPNFFLLLELNPDEPWDQELYQKVIEEKVRQWSYESLGIAKKALPAQFYRGLLPQIRQVMNDPRLRAQEARSASALLATRYQKEYQRFEEQLLLLNLKEAVDPEEVELFVKEFRHIVPMRTIERRIKTRIRQRYQDDMDSLHVLESSIAKNIEDHLAVVQVETLYDLLHVSGAQSTPFLFQAAEKLYTQEVRQHPSATVTARVELAGFAMMIFKSEEMRARYDETLRQASVQQLLEDLTESARRSRTKEIHAGQVRYYISKAEERGMSRAKALERLKEHGRINQWFIVIPEGEPPERERGIDEVGERNVVDGASEITDVQDPDEIGRKRDRVLDHGIWRRVRAVLLVLIQFIFFMVVRYREVGSIQPLLLWVRSTHVLLLFPTIPVTRHMIEMQFAFAAGNSVIHMLVAVVAVCVVVVLDVLFVVLFLTGAIPFVFALVGLLVGGVSACRSVVETLFTAFMGVQKWRVAEVESRGSARQKRDVLGSGWLMERMIAENLGVALHRTGEWWSDFADTLGEWRWMRGCFIAYWAYPVKFGCQLAGLTHYVISIEMYALCTCVYTVTLCIGEMTVFLGSGIFVVARTLYMRLHHIIES